MTSTAMGQRVDIGKLRVAFSPREPPMSDRFPNGGVHSVGSNSFADHGEGDVLRNDVANLAVLAVPSADFIRRSNYTSPHRGRSTLRNRLPLEGPFAFRSTLRTDPIDQQAGQDGDEVD